jgi:hypothetical protein
MPNSRSPAILALFSLTSSLMIVCLELPSASNSDLAKACRVNPLDERSALVIDGLRSSVQSMKWQSRVLEFTFCQKFLKGPNGTSLRWKWVIDRAGAVIYCLFWDHKGAALDEKVELNYVHPPLFLLDRIDNECVTLRVHVPAAARYIAIRRGVEPWHTKRVSLPLRRE